MRGKLFGIFGSDDDNVRVQSARTTKYWIFQLLQLQLFLKVLIFPFAWTAFAALDVSHEHEIWNEITK